MNELALLQEWFVTQCDGDWEHGDGIRIVSLDNPGWLVTIDMSRFAGVDDDVVLRQARMSEHDWVDVQLRGGSFVGAGGPKNLREILQTFLAYVATLSPAT